MKDIQEVLKQKLQELAECKRIVFCLRGAAPYLADEVDRQQAQAALAAEQKPEGAPTP